MPSLSRDLRRQLEKTIAGENGARQIAEAGAEQSLQRLAVDRHEPHTSLTPDERTLRNQLRAHGRQLGDKRDPQRGTQTIEHLKQAVAYEHWHRMLFARFLAENDLLLHPEHGVALSLDEVKELALGLKRDWIEVAAEYAQRMLLREVFRPDDPALRVPLPPETRLEMEERLNSLPQNIFFADDSLGWVYQFWQKDAKDKVNRSGVKIGADELAPVTQLFTEDYMVLFLLENTLGAWWTARRGTPELAGYTWTYLLLNQDGSPTAGTFGGWPKSAKEIRVLDPCMGSGHFLAFALPILARMRSAEEKLSMPDALRAVLRDNIFGLELDPRCSQIAAFNLALTSWKLAGRHFDLPSMNLACSGLGINAKEEDWVKLAGTDGRKQDIMRWLFSMFRNAPTLGSLIDPRKVGKPMVEEEITGLLPLLEQALATAESSDETRELAIAAQGMLASARIQSDRFNLVATNVPYLGRVGQNEILASHCADFHSDAKSDLATCFIDRCLQFCCDDGSVALLTPQNWLFMQSYKKFRERLLRAAKWNLVARIGEHGFESSQAAGAFTGMFVLTRRPADPGHRMWVIDVGDLDSPIEKATGLKSRQLIEIGQEDQLRNPDSRLVLEPRSQLPPLSDFCSSILGLGTGDYGHYGRYFWELGVIDDGWAFQQATVDETICWGGREHIVAWDSRTNRVRGMSAAEREQIHNQDQSGQQAWGRRGVGVGLMRDLKAVLYTGEKHDKMLAALVPTDEALLPALWALCSSPEYRKLVRHLDQNIVVANATLAKIPFDREYWQRVAEVQFPSGLPRASSADPTQWLFDGRPNGSDDPLQVAVARLVGYEWPRQSGSNIPDCSAIDPDGLEAHADADGILCLAALMGKEPAAERLRSVLRAAYGDHYNLAELLRGKSDTLENYLLNIFFKEHCDRFHDRPFVWHVWDGVKDGFHAFVNYHKLDRKALEKLIYSYVGDWLTRQRQDVNNDVEGADTRLAAAEHLQGELKKILGGEAPYDIFVRWKPMKEQPMGWEPDLNDGVRINIRPWITEARLYKAAKPSILRITPSIKYTKDRGKEHARDSKEFPWFGRSTDRVNDHHLPLEEKRRARGL